MVDAINGLTAFQNIQSASRANETQRTQPREDGVSLEQQDEVQISNDAQALAQAEQSAREVRQVLQDSPSETLGLDPDFVDQNV